MADNEQNIHPIPDYDAFWELIGDENNLENIDKIVKSYDYNQENGWIYSTFTIYLLDSTTAGFYRYTDLSGFKGDVRISLLKWYADKFDNDYYRAVAAFFEDDRVSFKRYLRESIIKCNDINTPYSEIDIGFEYLSVFKNGYKGFWEELQVLYKDTNTVKYFNDLLHAISLFYESDNSEEIRDALIDLGRVIPNGYIVNELLAISYSEDKMWKNALYYFELSLDSELQAIFWPVDICFQIAFCAGKSKDKEKAIKYYQECLSMAPYYLFARSNLGYELFLAKRYEESRNLMEKALADETNVSPLEIPYLYRNYVRVLMAMHQYKDAKEFISTHKKGIPSAVIEKVDAAPDINEDITKPQKAVQKSIDNIIDEPEEDLISEKKVQIGAKKMQFSTEKILEDELEHKILNGVEVFGQHLKMYEHSGDKYGRQYPFEIGRLDLLCEDDNDDLWIIELKKDSGYDDPFDQTKMYIDWFEKNKAKKGQKVYGIICLNKPSKQLIKKVSADPRIKLFEYNITYTEIK